MKIRPIAAALVLAFAPAALGVPAYAQSSNDDATTAAARARFREGVEFYDKGQFENARAAFLQAYALKKHPDVLFNLAFSCLKSNHPLDAERYFAQFLREAQSIAPAKKAEAEKGRDDARARLGRLEVSAAAGTEVTIDNERAGTAPLPEPIFVEPGAHSVKFKSPSGETDTQSVSVLAGQQVVARYKGGAAATPVPTPIPTPTASPTPTTPEPATTPKPDAAAPSDPRDADNSTPPPSSADTGTKSKGILSPPNNMVPVYIGGAIALAGFGTSVVMLIVKGNAQSNADSVAAAIRSKGGRAGVCSSTNAQDVATFGKACSALNDDNNAVNTDATVGNVALGVGILALLGTAAYYLAAPKRDSAAPATAHVRPVVTPILGPRVGGLSISGSF